MIVGLRPAIACVSVLAITAGTVLGAAETGQSSRSQLAVIGFGTQREAKWKAFATRALALDPYGSILSRRIGVALSRTAGIDILPDSRIQELRAAGSLRCRKWKGPVDYAALAKDGVAYVVEVWFVCAIYASGAPWPTGVPGFYYPYLTPMLKFDDVRVIRLPSGQVVAKGLKEGYFRWGARDRTYTSMAQGEFASSLRLLEALEHNSLECNDIEYSIRKIGEVLGATEVAHHD